MFVKVLGSAAGGGFPQWNCACPGCRSARAGEPSVRARTNDSLAVSPDGKAWCLLNAGPDVCPQIGSHVALHPDSPVRGSPIVGVLLTDAELDHTLGLLQLRQGAELDVYATAPVHRALAGPFPVRQLLEPYAEIRWSTVSPGDSFPLFGGQLSVDPIYLGCKPPRYVGAGQPSEEEAWVIGYRVADQATGGVIVYAPGVESWSPALEAQLDGADCLFFDGTFWQADELREMGFSELDAADMGHLPVAGPNGSMERLAKASSRRKVYIHVNNTNPMLDERSKACRSLREKGIEVGYDGMEMEV